MNHIKKAFSLSFFFFTKETLKLHLQNESQGGIAYKNYFEDFLLAQTVKVQDKIFKVIEIIESYEQVPAKYLKSVAGVAGLFEARIILGSSIWRVFCFFDEGRLVILLNGFAKKSSKTPKKEIEKARRLMNDYYNEKSKQDGN